MPYHNYGKVVIKRFVVSDFLFNKNLREFIEHIGLFMISSSVVMREHYVIHIGGRERDLSIVEISFETP